MRKGSLLFCIVTIFIVTGCTTISKNDAEKLIIEEYSNEQGKDAILSTKKKNNQYGIEWENKKDKSRGKSTVSSNGKIKITEAEIE